MDAITSNTATEQARAHAISRLRGLADLLEQNPLVPLPELAGRHCVIRSSDDDKHAELDRIAAALAAAGANVTRHQHSGHHYVHAIAPGGVFYEAFCVDDAPMAQFHALQSYAGAVLPEQPAVA